MNSFRIIIDGKDVTRFAIYPLNLQFTLDDALDQAFVELRNIPITEAYPAFTKVEITVNNDTESTIYYVGVDNCVVNQKTGRANHKILLTEETKILERVICRAKSFVKPLIKNYPNSNITALPQPLSDGEFVDIYNQYKAYFGSILNPSDTGTNYSTQSNYVDINATKLVYTISDKIYGTDIFSFKNQDDVVLPSGMTQLVVVHSLSGEVVTYDMGFVSLSNLKKNNSYVLYAVGNWSFMKNDGSSESAKIATRHMISVFEPGTTTPKDLTITRVVNELLEIAEPITRYDKLRFTLNPADWQKYEKTPCAELNFANGASLWENLLEIGKIIHCIPRLKNNVVYFDKLGSNEMLATNAFGTPISNVSDSTSEKFASHLDSVVNGLMNLDDSEQGSVYDPFKGGFRTLRSEVSNTDMRTTVDTAIIRTVEPIERITKLTVWYNNAEYDITPYVYEKKEYDLLYSNQGTYPYSKAFALYYVQGQPNIYGLTYKEADPVSNIFKKFAIENILSTVTGQNVDLGSSAWELIGGIMLGTDSSKLLNLAFNAKYITTINGRVRQAKRNIEDIKTVSVMAFNQSANKLSSVNYGKRLKGEIAMMGSAEHKLVFKTNNWSAIKTAAGKLYFDEAYGRNMYISNVTAKMWGGYFLVELGLTKNFNQLGRFVSVNSAVRQFEIDTNVSESYFVYEEYLVFSNSSEGCEPNDTSTIVFDKVLCEMVQHVISGNTDANGLKVTLAQAETADESNSLLSRVFLPVQSVALGNSLLFNFKYEDNYSAGEKLTTLSKMPYKLTQPVPYGDLLYGECKYLGVELLYNTSIKSNAGVISMADNLPIINDTDYSNTINKDVFAGNLNPSRRWIVHKSSRDALNVTYQIHFVTDCGLIFGEQLMQGNPLIGGTIAHVENDGTNPIINLYSRRVNEMTGETDDQPVGTALLDYKTYSHYAQLSARNFTTNNYYSWNIKDVNGRVLLAKNGTFDKITYYVKRKIGG